MKEDNMKQGWEIKKLGEVCEVNYGTRVVQKIDGGTKYPVYGGGGATFKIDRYNRENSLIVSRFAMSSQCVRYVSGKFFLNDSGLTIESKYTELSQSFLDKHIIALNDIIYSLGKGVAQKNLDIKELKMLNIMFPKSCEVQEQIVSELDLLSGIIEKKREQLKELDALAQSIFYDMFGDPITNEKGWEVKKLGEVCDDITDGDHMPPPKSEIGIPFLTISNIDKEKRELNFNDTFFVTEEYYDNIKENRKAKRGDVLYTVTGSYGIPVIVNTDKHFCFQRHIALLKPTQETLLPIFLCHWFLCDGVKFIADQVATGIAQKTVSLTSIRKFEIILPPLPLQHQFASKIEAIERQKELIKQSISETETLFNARMQEHFG